MRKPESVIGASNFILMPLMFLSPILMAKSVMPDWIRSVSSFNPVNWSVEAAREALSAHTDWNFVLLRIGSLLAFAAISAALATRAFRAYQRSA
jgi:ABC-2 type transport system permease protein